MSNIQANAMSTLEETINLNYQDKFRSRHKNDGPTFITKSQLYFENLEEEEYNEGSSNAPPFNSYDWSKQNWYRPGESSVVADKKDLKKQTKINYEMMNNNKAKKNLMKALAKPVTMTKAESMMLKMGWTGGALGKSGEGILEPITPNIAYAATTLGFGQSYKTRPLNKVMLKNRLARKAEKDLLIVNAAIILLEFVQNDTQIELYFDKKLNNKERQMIHTLVNEVINGDERTRKGRVKLKESEQVKSLVEEIQNTSCFVLNTHSEGEGKNRQLCVYKEPPPNVYLVTPDDLKPLVVNKADAKVQNKTEEHDKVENTTQQHEKVENTTQQHDKVENTTEEHAKVENTSGEHDKVENTIQQHEKVENTTQQHGKVKNTTEEHDIVENTSEEHAKVENTIQQHDKVENTTKEHCKVENTSKDHTKVENTSEVYDKVENTTEEHDKVENTKEEHDKDENTTEEHDKVENTTEEHDKVENTTEEHDKVENTTEEHDKVENTTEEHDKAENTTEDHDKVENTTEEHDKVEIITHELNNTDLNVKKSDEGNVVLDEDVIEISDNEFDVLETLTDCFLEFANEESYTDFRFLGPFDECELDAIEQLFERVAAGELGGAPYHLAFEIGEDQNGSTVICKYQKQLQNYAGPSQHHWRHYV